MTWNFTCRSLTRLDGEGWEELSLPLKPQSTCFGSPWRKDQKNAHNDRLPWTKWSSLNLFYDLESKNAAQNPAVIRAQGSRFPSSPCERTLHFDFAVVTGMTVRSVDKGEVSSILASGFLPDGRETKTLEPWFFSPLPLPPPSVSLFLP